MNISNSKLTIVTGASSNHFKSLLHLHCNFETYRKSDPNIEMFCWDLGLNDLESNFLRHYFPSIRNVKFNFQDYPEWININIEAGQYAWKPIIIARMLEIMDPDSKYILWFDSGNLINLEKNSLNYLRYFLSEHHIYSPLSGGVISEWTHPGMLKYLFLDRPDMVSYFSGLPCRAGGAIGYHVSEIVVKNFIKNFARLALIKKCIAPEGSNRLNHRQDQSLFTILYYFFIVENNLSTVDDYLGFSIQNDIG